MAGGGGGGRGGQFPHLNIFLENIRQDTNDQNM